MVMANNLPRKAPAAAGEAENGFHVGDVVLLGVAAPPEFRHRQAVVTHVQRSYCTVCVLDESGRCAIGECWPGFGDLELASRTLRLGVRVVIDGCSGARTQLLNGHAGIIVSHSKQGHPCFIRTGRQNDGPQLNVCVRLEQPPTTFQRRRSVLIEPRFLIAFEECIDAATSHLGDVVRTLSQEAPGTRLPRLTEERKQVSPTGVSTAETTASSRSGGRDSSPSLGGRDSSPRSGAASSPRRDAEPPMPVPVLPEGKRPAELADCSGLPLDAPETFLVLAARAERLADLTRLDGRGCAEGEIACSWAHCEEVAPGFSSRCCPHSSSYWQLPWAWFVVRLMVTIAWFSHSENGKAGVLAAVYVGSLFCQCFHFIARRHLGSKDAVGQMCNVSGVSVRNAFTNSAELGICY